jgi:hypothetical protein
MRREGNYNMIVFVDAFYVALNLTFMYYYLTVNGGTRIYVKNGVPLTEAGFDEWISLANKAKIISRLCGSICVLTMFK